MTHILIDFGVKYNFHVVLRVEGLTIAFLVEAQTANGSGETSSGCVGAEFGSRSEQQSQNGGQSGNVGQQRCAAGDDAVRVQLGPDLNMKHPIRSLPATK